MTEESKGEAPAETKSEAPIKSQRKPISLGELVRIVGVVVGIIGLAWLAYIALGKRGTASYSAASVGDVGAVTHTVSGPPVLPVLRRVMLSTGGVGYFEYEAQVTGNVELALPVRMDQVDDVLKSIVVFDNKNNTGFVQLPSRAPLSDIFRGLPFGPAALESNAALLDALKGAEVTVRGSKGAQGRIVSVNKEDVKGEGDTVITHHRVGVMTDSGLQQFILEEANTITFDDPVLARQIEQALAAVAEHREGQGRTLKIRANGEGSRTVTVAYVVEAPLWKSSYRVTALDGGKARLQGWAVLENVTGNDWVDVTLTVVTGNPVTFRQALYATYYVSRPEVPVEVLGRILPRPDEGSVEAEDRAVAAPAPAPPPPPVPAMAPPSGRIAKAMGGFARRDRDEAETGKPMAAESREAATQVTFTMPYTVTVMNGQSLAVPIVDKEVPGEMISLYQPDVHPRHPLAALKLVNSTETGLPPGVLTLYKREKLTDYIGDAQLATLPVAESRMLSFALDQKIHIDREDKFEKRISQATIANGIFKASVVDQRNTIYTIKGAANEDRRITIEHPRQAGWELVTPDPKTAEMTDSAFRIPIEVKAGSTIKQTVTTQWPRLEEQALVDLDVDTVLAYAANTNLTESQRAAFAKIAEYKHGVEDLDRQIEVEGEARDRVFEEQERIRENIKAIPAGSDVQSRYLRSLSQLEDQAETRKRAIDRLQQQRAGEQQKLANYVAGLQG